MAAGRRKESLLEALGRVPDPRGLQGRRYPAASMLAMAVCAMACGARDLPVGQRASAVGLRGDGDQADEDSRWGNAASAVCASGRGGVRSGAWWMACPAGAETRAGHCGRWQDAPGDSRGRAARGASDLSLCSSTRDRAGAASCAWQRLGIGCGQGGDGEPGPEGPDRHRRRPVGAERHLPDDHGKGGYWPD